MAKSNLIVYHVQHYLGFSKSRIFSMTYDDILLANREADMIQHQQLKNEEIVFHNALVVVNNEKQKAIEKYYREHGK